ncbi:hypothetical protein ACFL2A_00130 [Thermodesulfobacteriota bacterium]
MKKITYTIFVFTFIALFFSGNAYSKTPYEYFNPQHNISLNTTFGFNNAIKSGTYNYAVFFIENAGKDFSGNISIKIGGRNFSRTKNFKTFSKKIYLPELSKKRFYVYFYCDQVYSDTPVQFELVSDKKEKVFAADLTKERKVSLIRTSNYNSKNGVEGFLTLVISDNNFGYNFLTGVNVDTTAKTKGAPNNRIISHHVKYPSYETLPDDAVGYDGANLILLSGLTASKLSYEQKTALLRYLYEGGNILITKSDKDLWMQDEFFNKLLPGELNGITTLSSIGGYTYNRAQERVKQIPILETKSYELLDVKYDKNTRNYVRFEKAPIVLRKRVGAGAVFLVTFDPTKPPFVGAKENLDLFGMIFNSIVLKKGIVADYNFNDASVGLLNSMLDSLMAKDVIRQVTIFLLITFMTYLIIIGPLNYFFLKRKNKLEYAWVTIPIISLFYSIFFLTGGYAIRGTENYILTHNLVSVYDSNNFYVNTLMSVFASKEDHYEIGIERLNLHPKSFEANFAEVASEIEFSEEIMIKDVEIKKWSVRNFKITGHIYEDSEYFIKATRIGADQKTGGTKFTFDYNLPFEIERLFVLSKGYAYELDMEIVKRDKAISTRGVGSTTFKGLADFANENIVYGYRNKDSKEDEYLKSPYTQTLNMQAYMSKTTLFAGMNDDCFVILTDNPMYSRKLKGETFNTINRTAILVHVGEK